MMKDVNKLIFIAIIIGSFIIAGAIFLVNQEKGKEPVSEEISVPQEIAEKVINFINQNMLPENVTASLLGVAEENGVYKIHLSIGEEEYDSYVTKDGKLLFPEGITLEETQEIQPQNLEETTPTEEPSSQGSLEGFAKCLGEKGMKFYGAFWCGWCKNQKELFEEAVQYLPYIECSDEETREMTSECQEAGITSFPTWELPDGEKSSGFKSLEQLAEMSGCSL